MEIFGINSWGLYGLNLLIMLALIIWGQKIREVKKSDTWLVAKAKLGFKVTLEVFAFFLLFLCVISFALLVANNYPGFLYLYLCWSSMIVISLAIFLIEFKRIREELRFQEKFKKN